MRSAIKKLKIILLPITITFSLQGAFQEHIDWQSQFKEAYRYQEFAQDQATIVHLEDKAQAKIIQIIPHIATMDIHEFLHEIQHLDVPLKNELLIESVYLGLISIVRALLDNGASDVNTALIAAASLRQNVMEVIAQLLLDRGANINHANAHGDTALIWVSYDGRIDAAEWLLRHGAGINYANNDGDTALIVAAHHGHTAVVKLLLESGANPNHENKVGYTALMWAVGGYKDMVQLLLEHGANVNHADIDGNTALTLASQYNQEFFVRLLIEHGAYVNHYMRCVWNMQL